MPTLTISLDGVDLKSIELTQARTTLGRRPYNDIVVDHLAVSGEHAVFVQKPEGLELVDLNSTNGTYVNGKAIIAALLTPGDLIEIGRYKMRVALESEPTPANPVADTSPSPAALTAHAPPATTATMNARIRVLSGPAAGKEMPLTKVVTTLGKPGVAVAAINHRADGYTFSLIDGHTPPLVNGQPVGKEPVMLRSNDVITLAGTEMLFLS